MPNRQTHGIVGLATGGVTALWLAQTQSRAEQALELLGGASAAWVAARLPDLIDLTAVLVTAHCYILAVLLQAQRRFQAGSTPAGRGQKKRSSLETV